MKVRLAILAALVLLTRASESDKRQTTGPTCIKQDIVYMLDSSRNIGIEDFLQQLEFVKNNVKNYNVSPSCTRVGIVTNNQGAYNKFYLDGYSTQQQLLSAINNIVYTPGTTTNTAGVINYVTTTAFTTQHGARSGVPHHGILVTGSTSSSPSLTVAAANRARQSGVTFYTVGVGHSISLGELSGVADDPKNQFTANSFSSLDTLADPVATRVNGAVTPVSGGSLSTPNSCLQQADVVFLVDGSGSIGATNFVKLENFVKGIVGQLDMGSNKVHVGLVQFSNYPSKQFPLNMYTSRQDAMNAIQNMRYIGGGTNTADAIRYMRQNMFTQGGGARSNVPRIGIVITDGQSSNPSQTQTEANNARADHISMMAVGVDSGVDVNELHNIADDPDSANAFQVSSYDQLGGIVSSIVNRACQVKATASPSILSGTTSPGTGSVLNDTCKDARSDCASYGQTVCQGTYAPWSKANCARFCGHCKPLYTTAPPPCVDKLSNCARYQAGSCVGNYKAWATENCRKYCGYCDASSQSYGFYGSCYYKGKTYKQGEKWDDGCDYECICETGQTGKYQCYNKCPVYYNLPSTCTLVKNPNDCCLQPVCNFQPSFSSFEATMTGKTPDGTNVCIYKGHQYYQGQSWQDGCQYTCTCEDAKIGTYKCQDSCPTYSSVPNYCHMEKKPGDCCSKPVCEFKTQQGSFTGMGTISGHGVGLSPTAPPPCVDVQTDCNLYETGFCQNYKPWARDNCRKTCNLCVDNTPNPSPTDVCMYNGQSFNQGQTWQVGCDTMCTCENSVYGYYRCVNSCPKYNNIPSGCTEVKKAGDCCTTVQCSSGKFLSSTGNLGSIGNGGLINVGNSGVQPTIPTGGVAPPGTGGTVFQAPTLNGCLYKSNMYSQGQIWQDGCDYTCQCDNATTGLYMCSPKCPLFPNLPSQCKLENDPSDRCCQRPQCQFTGTPVPVTPVYKPSVTGYNVVEPPSPSELYHGTQTIAQQFTVPANTPAPATNTPATVTGHCVYNGRQYRQGQSWDDGCTYRCECLDSATGSYKCRYMCPQYTNLPAQCQLVQDPNNTCCKVPVCNFPTQTSVVTNHGTGPHLKTTPTTPPQTTKNANSCLYKGQYYTQGQSWYDACDFKCSCDDATVGFYTCTRRCPEYQNVPVGCNFVTDPNDPTCCKVPQCSPTPGVSPGGMVIPTIPPGSFVGQPNVTGYVGFCEYKGTHYLSGDSWSDGCDYTCVCENEEVGRYRCTEKCPTYTALPPQCTLVPDFAKPCCKRPDCTGQVTSSGGQNPTPASGSSPTLVPNPNICVYKTAHYSQGQTWTDGCQLRCRCDNSSRGLYVCNDRCAKYQSPLPINCKLETDPSDSCCQQPKCDWSSTLGQITGGTVAPNLLPTKLPGYISGHAITPAPTPWPNGTYPSPQPLGHCVYKGSQYSQNQKWSDGCDYDCQCLDALQGRYECREKCQRYSYLPEQCHLIKDPANPCCFKPVCDFPISVGQLTGHFTPAPSPGVSTIAPQPTPSPQPHPSLPGNVCVYKNSKYTQGQKWFDGCNFVCQCEDGDNGIYRCTERCAKYSSLPAGCTLVADPSDPLCCEAPQCTPQMNSSVPYPTPPLGHKTGGYVTPAPTLKPGVSPSPGQTMAPPLLQGVCIYNGKQYTQDQKWQDGCKYNCECQDANTGTYDCSEMCPKYPKLPPQCRLVQDLQKPCCMTPSCNFQIPTPGPGVSTLAPNIGPTSAPVPKALCMYNGVAFKQGERWDDGCDLQCVCEDETEGYYRCNQRCATYNNLPAGCTLQTDPADSCCQVPVCSPTPAPGITLAPLPGAPTPTAGPGLIPSLRPVIIGQGVTPSPKPGISTPHPLVPVCVYYGKKYGQGEKWRDGCQYICECIDANIGQYKCQERCATYTQIPANCRMVTDPADSCCKKPECSPTAAPNPLATPTPQPGVSTLTPPLGPTAAPQPKEFCVMNGKYYTPGQTWDDGCDKKCVCEDGTTGPHYTCLDRCKFYTSVPKECTMVPDPADPLCCKVPQCIPVPGTNGIPTPGPTDKPVVYTNAPHAVVTGTGTPPTPTRAPTPAPQPGISPGPTLAPLPRPEVCVYKAQQYLPGQKWTDSCQYDCICEDGKTGRYRCTEKCGTYPNPPPQCTLQRDPNDFCCHILVCDWNKPTPNPYAIPSPQPGVSTVAPSPAFCVYNGVPFKQGQTLDDGCTQTCRCDDADTNYYNCYDRCPNYHTTGSCVLVTDPTDSCCQVPQCNYIPTPAPGVSPSPGPLPSPIPTAVPGIIISKPDLTRPPSQRGFCQYYGIKYTKGQQWEDACNYICECLDDHTGQYKCIERCPRYTYIPSYCTMVEDPDDSCCKKPICQEVNPTPAPSLTPSPSPGASPTPNSVSPGLMSQSPTPGVCVMNGNSYTPGQEWYEGCEQFCVCQDGTGNYTCTPRCPQYSNIQPTCVFVPDPYDPLCCQMPQCTSPNPSSTLTPTPKTDFCVYNGVPLLKGQEVKEGCDKICRCEDSDTNTIVCSERCAAYPPLPASCTLVTDPNDQCCRVPQCVPTATCTDPSSLTAQPKGTITGSNMQKEIPLAEATDACLYKGVQYKEGATWEDGCAYNCTCTDEKTGSYKCDEKCPEYINLPPEYYFIKDPKDQCCKIPICQLTTTQKPKPTPKPTPGPSKTPSPQPGSSPVSPTLTPPIQLGTSTQAPQPTPGPRITPNPQPGSSPVSPTLTPPIQLGTSTQAPQPTPGPSKTPNPQPRSSPVSPTLTPPIQLGSSTPATPGPQPTPGPSKTPNPQPGSSPVSPTLTPSIQLGSSTPATPGPQPTPGPSKTPNPQPGSSPVSPTLTPPIQLGTSTQAPQPTPGPSKTPSPQPGSSPVSPTLTPPTQLGTSTQAPQPTPGPSKTPSPKPGSSPVSPTLTPPIQLGTSTQAPQPTPGPSKTPNPQPGSSPVSPTLTPPIQLGTSTQAPKPTPGPSKTPSPQPGSSPVSPTLTPPIQLGTSTQAPQPTPGPSKTPSPQPGSSPVSPTLTPPIQLGTSTQAPQPTPGPSKTPNPQPGSSPVSSTLTPPIQLGTSTQAPQPTPGPSKTSSPQTGSSSVSLTLTPPIQLGSSTPVTPGPQPTPGPSKTPNPQPGSSPVSPTLTPPIQLGTSTQAPQPTPGPSKTSNPQPGSSPVSPTLTPPIQLGTSTQAPQPTPGPSKTPNPQPGSSSVSPTLTPPIQLGSSTPATPGPQPTPGPSKTPSPQPGSSPVSPTLTPPIQLGTNTQSPQPTPGPSKTPNPQPGSSSVSPTLTPPIQLGSSTPATPGPQPTPGPSKTPSPLPGSSSVSPTLTPPIQLGSSTPATPGPQPTPGPSKTPSPKPGSSPVSLTLTPPIQLRTSTQAPQPTPGPSKTPSPQLGSSPLSPTLTPPIQLGTSTQAPQPTPGPSKTPNPQPGSSPVSPTLTPPIHLGTNTQAPQHTPGPNKTPSPQPGSSPVSPTLTPPIQLGTSTQAPQPTPSPSKTPNPQPGSSPVSPTLTPPIQLGTSTQAPQPTLGPSKTPNPQPGSSSVSPTLTPPIQLGSSTPATPGPQPTPGPSKTPNPQPGSSSVSPTLTPPIQLGTSTKAPQPTPGPSKTPSPQPGSNPVSPTLTPPIQLGTSTQAPQPTPGPSKTPNPQPGSSSVSPTLTPPIQLGSSTPATPGPQPTPGPIKTPSPLPGSSSVSPTLTPPIQLGSSTPATPGPQPTPGPSKTPSPQPGSSSISPTLAPPIQLGTSTKAPQPTPGPSKTPSPQPGSSPLSPTLTPPIQLGTSTQAPQPTPGPSKTPSPQPRSSSVLPTLTPPIQLGSSTPATPGPQPTPGPSKTPNPQPGSSPVSPTLTPPIQLGISTQAPQPTPGPSKTPNPQPGSSPVSPTLTPPIQLGTSTQAPQPTPGPSKTPNPQPGSSSLSPTLTPPIQLGTSTKAPQPTPGPSKTPSPQSGSSSVSPTLTPPIQLGSSTPATPGPQPTPGPNKTPNPQPGSSTAIPILTPGPQPSPGLSTQATPTPAPSYTGSPTPAPSSAVYTINPGQNTGGITGFGTRPSVTINPGQNTGGITGFGTVSINPGQNTGGITGFGTRPPVTINPGQNTGGITGFGTVSINPGQNTGGITGFGTRPPVTINPGQNTGGITGFGTVSINPGQNTGGITGFGTRPPITINSGQNTGGITGFGTVSINPGQNTGGITGFGTRPPVTINPGQNTGGITGFGTVSINPGQNTGGITGFGTRPPVTINPGQNTGGITGFGTVSINPGQNTGGITGFGTRPPVTINPGLNTGGMTGFGTVSINPGQNTGGYTGFGTQPPVTTSFTGVRDKCVYKDMTLHGPGTSWQDGCDYTCYCDDPTTNSYRCSARCQIFSDVPTSCTLVPDPNDNCCKTLACSGTLTPMIGGPISGSATLSPSVTNVIPIGTHTSFTGSGRPNVIPGMTSGGTGSICYYKGTVHTQGQSWDDGCDYTCTCDNGQTGHYTCTSKCPTYPAIPSYCKMNKVPGLCCPAMSCNIPQFGNYNPAPQLNPTPAPSLAPGQTPPLKSNWQIYPGGTQPVIGGTQYPGGGYALPGGVSYGSIRNQCIYKNRLYNQGDKWDDGCVYQCECLDGKSGYYRCKALCPTYTLPSGCYLRTMPGQCCAQPYCNGPGGTQVNPLTNPSGQYQVYGSYPGGTTGFRPGYNPSYGSSWNSQGYTNQCIYNGHVYTQGQMWDDGCDYSCECTDAHHGMYTCSDKCQTYTRLPPSCRLVTLPGQCCQIAECVQPTTTTVKTPATPTPGPVTGCYDAISNCDAYGSQSCSAPYTQWADRNCRAYCGFCRTTTPAISPTTGLCADKVSNCQAYGQSACTGIYEPWARDNCKKYCNYCITTLAPTLTPAPAVSGSQVCIDAISNCVDFGNAACLAPYQQWAQQNCNKSCGFCSTTTPAISPTTGLCADKVSNCQAYGQSACTGIYAPWARDNCKKYCNYCTATGTQAPVTGQAMTATNKFGIGLTNAPISFTGMPNQCYYKGRLYNQGQTWQDGCQYNCTCEDSTTGFYRCKDLCPIWSNLPTGCTLQKPAGECCSKPVCAGAGSSAVIFNNNSTANTCYYGNKFYHQGDKWRDGCKYSCECVNGKLGQYRCNDLCLKWNGLPSVCHMLPPAAGKCCSKPLCPSYVQLQYPPGYVEPDCPTPCSTP